MASMSRWTASDEQHDPERFRREILPRLQGITLRTMAKTTGLSVDYCSKIRRGLRVSHLRHGQSLNSVRG